MISETSTPVEPIKVEASGADVQENNVPEIKSHENIIPEIKTENTDMQIPPSKVDLDKEPEKSVAQGNDTIISEKVIDSKKAEKPEQPVKPTFAQKLHALYKTQDKIPPLIEGKDGIPEHSLKDY